MLIFFSWKFLTKYFRHLKESISINLGGPGAAAACRTCFRTGHSERECRSESKRSESSQKVNKIISSVLEKRKLSYCGNCGVTEHSFSDCRESKYVEDLNLAKKSAPNRSTFRKSSNSKPVVNSRPVQNCFQCGKPGHLKSDCPEQKSRSKWRDRAPRRHSPPPYRRRSRSREREGEREAERGQKRSRGSTSERRVFRMK